MAKGNSVIVTADPKGTWEECIISGTDKPGVVMELVPTTAPVSGRFTYRATTRNNGAAGGIAILDIDRQQGKTRNDAYVSGTRAFLYWPVAGEEFNMLLSESVGTGTSGMTNIGDLLAVQKTSGQLIAGGALTSRPFMLMERVTLDTYVDTHHWVKYLGNQA